MTDGSQICMRDTAFCVGGAQRPALRDVERGTRTGLRLAMLITRRGPKKKIVVKVCTLLANIQIQYYTELS